MDSVALNFAYKYPFSNEAKAIVESQPNKINPKYLILSSGHIDNIISNSLDYKEISLGSIKLDYIMTYLYSRMILSASKRLDLIKSYALAESRRSSKALAASDISEMLKLSSELDIRVTERFHSRNEPNVEELAMSFTDYVSNSPKKPEFELVNQKLSGGIVLLDKNKMSKILEQIIFKEILKGLPIKSADLPREVVDYTKTLKFKMPEIRTGARPEKKKGWIERLLQTPIADIRHRTVNLILAPYLVNTKGLEVEQAVKIINEYIEKCKEIDPSTKINESYIRYQCSYAKRRGLKPLSLDRAKELLGNTIIDDA